MEKVSRINWQKSEEIHVSSCLDQPSSSLFHW